MIGTSPLERSAGVTTLMETALALRPSSGAKMAAAILTTMVASTGAPFARRHAEEQSTWWIRVIAVILMVIGVVVGWRLRGESTR